LLRFILHIHFLFSSFGGAFFLFFVLYHIFVFFLFFCFFFCFAFCLFFFFTQKTAYEVVM